MAVYRFRVSLEDNDDVYRDIDIKAVQTFEQFHSAIQEAFKFDAKHSASFFVSDDYWRKNQEITLKKEDLPLDEEEIRKNVDPKKLMSETKIAKFIEQPHQRFVYIFDPVVQWSFLIEMVKITEENTKQSYPLIARSVGASPKQYKQVTPIKEEEEENPDLAMLNLLKGLDLGEDEIYKNLPQEEHSVEEDDLSTLEGEEGEEMEEDEAEMGDGEEEMGDFDEGEDN
jgi:hypothetical protein